MNHWYARMVFFVAEADSARDFYVQKLGFQEDWHYLEGDQVYVVQVSKHGFEIILNTDLERAGKGRAFLSLEDNQVQPLRDTLASNKVDIKPKHWGMPVSEIVDLDGNELIFSPPLI